MNKLVPRVQQAEENCLCLLHADMQKRAALKERTARSLVQKAEGNKSLYLWSLWGCVGLQHVGLQHLIFLQHALAPLLP